MYHLGAQRLAADEDFEADDIDLNGFDPDDPDAISGLPLTYSQAHALAPSRCYLAPSTELERIQDLDAGMGWMGVYKNFEQAFEDQSDTNIKVRREGWYNVDGSRVDDDAWMAGEPELVDSTSTVDTEMAAVYSGTGNGLGSLTPDMSLPGAYYLCCSAYEFEGSTADDNKLEGILLSLVALEC